MISPEFDTMYNYIYQLSDPRDGLVRYIGCSEDFPTLCMRHLGVTRFGTVTKCGPQRLYRWRVELNSLGLRPILKLLQKLPFRIAFEVETSYIWSYSQSAPGQLLNIQQKNLRGDWEPWLQPHIDPIPDGAFDACGVFG